MLLKRKEKELKSQVVLIKTMGTTNKVETISKVVKTVHKAKMVREEIVHRDKVAIKGTDLQDKVVKTVRVAQEETVRQVKVAQEETVHQDKVAQEETVSETIDRDKEQCLSN